MAKVAAMGPQEAVRQAEKPGRKAVMSGGLRFLGLPDMNLVRSFSAVPKIYFPLILLAMVNIWDNLSRKFPG